MNTSSVKIDECKMTTLATILYNSTTSMDLDDLDGTLLKFITPFFIHRDLSHNIDHVIRVVGLTDHLILYSYNRDIQNQHRHTIRCLAKIIAWLHDVDDRKYHDPAIQAEQKMTDFLATMFPDVVVPMILKAVKYVSYSQQIKLFGTHPPQWYLHLPDTLIVARNFVSDADKIDALGEIGIQRCLAYSRYKHPDEDEQFHINHLIQHYQEKLKWICPKYISTDIGHIIARHHQDVMDQRLQALM
jgi:uncharacterized protein